MWECVCVGPWGQQKKKKPSRKNKENKIKSRKKPSLARGVGLLVLQCEERSSHGMLVITVDTCGCHHPPPHTPHLPHLCFVMKSSSWISSQDTCVSVSRYLGTPSIGVCECGWVRVWHEARATLLLQLAKGKCGQMPNNSIKFELHLFDLFLKATFRHLPPLFRALLLNSLLN